MHLRLIGAVLAASVAIGVTAAGAAPAPWSGMASATVKAAQSGKITAATPMYYVELAGQPAALYSGGVAGLKATSPAVTGAPRISSDAPETQAYVQHLVARQDDFVSSVDKALGRDVRVLFHYRYVLNGVALVLSAAEAELVASMPGVTRVVKSGVQYPHTDAGPAWIGAPGIWDGSAVPNGTGTMGEGVIVGIIDTGINMDHPSFAAIGGDGYEHTNPFGEGRYKGYCDPEHPGHDPERHRCNAKLVGAWSFEGATEDPEDDDGHGSHTASTAAGNFVTATMILPTMILTTPLQGVAPHANIISYDVCVGGCPDVATAAGIDQAVDDGVHVTNYSIGTSSALIWSQDNVVMTAYRNLREAGISAAVSAGNAGPEPATTAAVGPWMAAVAASTHNRVVENAVVDMTGGDTPPPDEIVGKSLSDRYGPAPIVYAQGYIGPDGTPDDGGCMAPFPEGTFANGEIVLCDRGVIARVEKGSNVLAGGAGGLVLANTVAEGNSLVADPHVLPAVHISYDDGVVLKTWLASGTGHMAAINGSRFNRAPGAGDIMADFSSRGPTLWNNCCIRPWGLPGSELLDLLKPDVTAPGVDIWAAAATDPGDPAENPEFQSLSGTSMSGPHMAGALALMRALHPDWSPAQVQSALMLTAVTEGLRKEDGSTPADPLDIGAGRINVSQAARTGLVLDMRMDDAVAANPDQGGDPSSLNLASMANYHCNLGCSWTRTVQSVWDEEVSWTVSTEAADEGLLLAVTPEEFTLGPGATQVITVTADSSALPSDEFTFGQILLSGDGASEATPHPAHMPVAVMSPSIVYPRSVQSEFPPLAVLTTHRAIGTATLAGFRTRTVGSLSATAAGLARPELVEVNLPEDPDNGDPFDGGGGTQTKFFDVPEGALRVVGETKSSEANDIDLFLGIDANADGEAQDTEVVCVSAGGSWTEYCDVRDPPAGRWWILVQNWDPSEPGAVDNVEYYYGAVAPGVGTLGVAAPGSATSGTPWDLGVQWDLPSIAPGDVFYGVALVSDGAPGSGNVMNLAIDLLGIPPPPALFLPDVRKNFVAPDPNR